MNMVFISSNLYTGSEVEICTCVYDYVCESYMTHQVLSNDAIVSRMFSFISTATIRQFLEVLLKEIMVREL
jgi:hypothetical protein